MVRSSNTRTRRVLWGALCIGSLAVVACGPEDDLTRRTPALSGYQVGGSTGGGYQVGGSTGGGYQVGGSTGGGFQTGSSHGGGYQVGGAGAPAGGGGGGGTGCDAVCAKLATCGISGEGCVSGCASATETQKQCIVSAEGCSAAVACVSSSGRDGGTTNDGGSPQDAGTRRDGGTGAEATCEEICNGFIECGTNTTLEACLGSCNSTVTPAQKRCAKAAGADCSALNGCFG